MLKTIKMNLPIHISRNGVSSASAALVEEY